MYFSIQRFKENKSNSCFIKIVKILYHNDPPPITAPANNGQNLQVPSRPLSRGYTVLHGCLDVLLMYWIIKFLFFIHGCLKINYPENMRLNFSVSSILQDNMAISILPFGTFGSQATSTTFCAIGLAATWIASWWRTASGFWVSEISALMAWASRSANWRSTRHWPASTQDNACPLR